MTIWTITPKSLELYAEYRRRVDEHDEMIVRLKQGAIVEEREAIGILERMEAARLAWMASTPRHK